MKTTIKKALALLMVAMMTVGTGMTVMASQWQQNATGWWYQEDNGTWPANGWKWIDGKCYYFDGNGYMLSNTTTPDGYQVDASGVWVVNGVVQTQGTGNVNHSANYDPAHPLAGKIDEWNLRITPDKYFGYIVNNNVQSMLTNQMDQYFAAPVGNYVDENGNHIYTTQEDYDVARKEEQDIYNWFCNWLNGMNFESMTEMDKAKEIQKVLAAANYEDGYVNYSTPYRDEYAILINKQGHCSEFTMTARSLAKALGLKSGSGGSANHSWYYIQVDGKLYSGENEYLNLNKPTSDYAYVD